MLSIVGVPEKEKRGLGYELLLFLEFNLGADTWQSEWGKKHHM